MTRQQIPGYCALCISRCGCLSTVENGVLTQVEADPRHPTGKSFCIKGKAAPEMVNSPDRLLRPLKRSRPKGDPDPGWQPISWDEALDFTAQGMQTIASRLGPEALAFSVTTPSGTAVADGLPWIFRLINAYGSPNTVWTTHICNWHKDFATAFTIGADSGMPDFARTGCLVLWGFNPATCWPAQASEATAAIRRGAKLIVIDPRQAGLAHKADHWLRVRPGTDGALALGIAAAMIESGRYDIKFIRDWSNGAFLVRDDNGRFLTEADLAEGGATARYVAWDEAAQQPAIYDPSTGAYREPPRHAALSGSFDIATLRGPQTCRPAFDLYAALCRDYSPEKTQAITGVSAEQIRAVAEMLHTHGPVSYYAWAGVGQSTNASQTSRAMNILYALTGSLDAPGGNAHFSKPRLNPVFGFDLRSPQQAAKTLGREERPLGPAKNGWITTRELYRAILEEQPYAVKGLLSFGSNLLQSRPSPQEGVAALRSLDFFVHCDLFLTPMANDADVILPVASPWEREGLAAGFMVSQEADALLQLRQAVVPPRGESRSDAWIAFELAKRLGLARHFFGGDIEAGLRYMLEPCGVTPEQLRAQPQGVRLPLATRYREYEEKGFATPSRRVEIYSQALLDIGQAPLPHYLAPAAGHERHPEWRERYPLTLTTAKWVQYCHSQQRNLPSLRRKMPHPLVELHPDTAAQRRIAEQDWVNIRSPHGTMQARAKFNPSLERGVICTQYGWWRVETEGADTGANANYNSLIGNRMRDPISGSFPLRAYACEVEKIGV
ncbi:MAG: molybdopterin-dependent oxidoreductase [Sulfuricellaceae bacterium]|nr:molybdopterin-dependent oxidoreductase [Sulfuricellaceae bacterium]